MRTDERDLNRSPGYRDGTPGYREAAERAGRGYGAAGHGAAVGNHRWDLDLGRESGRDPDRGEPGRPEPSGRWEPDTDRWSDPLLDIEAAGERAWSRGAAAGGPEPGGVPHWVATGGRAGLVPAFLAPVAVAGGSRTRNAGDHAGAGAAGDSRERGARRRRRTRVR